MQIEIFFTNHFDEKIKDEDVLSESLEKILIEISKEVSEGGRSGKVSDLCNDEYFAVNAEYEIIEN